MATSTAKTKTPKKKTAKSQAKADVSMNKKDLMAKFGVHAQDTGSSKVQIALLTAKINQLSAHLEEHPKDDHSRRGLLGMVGKRRKHLNYLRLHDKPTYDLLLEELKLRK